MTGPYTGDFCPDCGSDKMIRTGTCVTCQDCGSNTGCGRYSFVFSEALMRRWTLILTTAFFLCGCVSGDLAAENLKNVRALKGAVVAAGVPDPAPNAESVAVAIVDDVEAAAALQAIPFIPPVGGIPWTELAIAAVGLFTAGKTAVRVISAKKTKGSATPA